MLYAVLLCMGAPHKQAGVACVCVDMCLRRCMRAGYEVAYVREYAYKWVYHIRKLRENCMCADIERLGQERPEQKTATVQ